MRKFFFSIMCCMGLVALCHNSFAQTKGVWLTNVASDAMMSREGIRQAVERCNTYGINTIYTVVLNRGYTLYPSGLMKEMFGSDIDPVFKGRDPLQELIEEAQPYNIKVVAWFEFGFSYAYKNEGTSQVIDEFPRWAAIDARGDVVQKNGFFWMNAFDPEVQSFLISLVSEVVANYDVYGIQGDDRLPAIPSTAGYDDYTVAKYAEEHGGNLPPTDHLNPEWLQWRADILTNFLGELYSEVKNLKPHCIVSLSPSIFPWSLHEYLQDWPTWLERGYADEICPQVYRYSHKAYKKTLQENVLDHIKPEDRHKLFPGILLKVDDYTAPVSILRKAVRTNRRHGLEGEVFFFYEGMPERDNFFRKYADK